MNLLPSSILRVRSTATTTVAGICQRNGMKRTIHHSKPITAASVGNFCSCCGMFGVSHSSMRQQVMKSPIIQQQRRELTFTSMGTDEADGAHPHVDTLLTNNKQWIKDSLKKDPEFLKKLSSPQKPRFLYIGCSDSRVPANEILGLGPGEVFVHRNIGNQVPGNCLNVLSVLEFAVGHLNIRDIIVTGHYDCGAIEAASSRQDLGTLEHWLRQIRDVHRLHKDTLDHFANRNARRRALVELNVVEQCLNVFKTGIVQRKRNQQRKVLVDAGKNPKLHHDEIWPRIHGMVFDHTTGRIKYIPVDFKHRIGSLDHIYGLYDMPEKTNALEAAARANADAAAKALAEVEKSQAEKNAVKK